ncbi:MAG TPA: hypothetical protein PK771_04870, partial [Spirochaetota bacterium]|nr:hypothetical protein [Spirochaetota bacterium]
MDVNVIIDSPIKNSNLLYKTGYYCLDPFVFIQNGDKNIGYLPSTEFEKAKKKSKLHEVYNLTVELQKLSETKRFPLMKSSIVLEY